MFDYVTQNIGNAKEEKCIEIMLSRAELPIFNYYFSIDAVKRNVKHILDSNSKVKKKKMHSSSL